MQTTCSSLGGKCFDKRVLVLRRMNLLTIFESSVEASSAACFCFSVAVGSLPTKIGDSYLLRKVGPSPRIPGLVKSTIA